MKKSAVALLASLGFAFAAQPVLASEELARKNACTACHAVDKKLVGPAYKEVAAKYAKDPKAEALLVAKVKAGGVGNWGQVPMPPNAHVKDDDIKAIVKWILAIK